MIVCTQAPMHLPLQVDVIPITEGGTLGVLTTAHGEQGLGPCAAHQHWLETRPCTRRPITPRLLRRQTCTHKHKCHTVITSFRHPNVHTTHPCAHYDDSLTHHHNPQTAFLTTHRHIYVCIDANMHTNTHIHAPTYTNLCTHTHHRSTTSSPCPCPAGNSWRVVWPPQADAQPQRWIPPPAVVAASPPSPPPGKTSRRPFSPLCNNSHTSLPLL